VIRKSIERRGLNKLSVREKLTDHTNRNIARPNNDFVEARINLDVRNRPVMLELPALNSDYASLEVSGYDHYCDVILSTRTGAFTKPACVLFLLRQSQR